MGLVKARRRREVRPHPVEQGQGRLERQFVPAGEFCQPATLAGDGPLTGDDPVDVVRGPVDELVRLVWRDGGVDAVVAPSAPGVETLDVGPLVGGQEPAGERE